MHRAIEECDRNGWYEAIRQNSPWWIGADMSSKNRQALWRFIHPNAPPSSVRDAALRALRPAGVAEKVEEAIDLSLPKRIYLELVEEHVQLTPDSTSPPAGQLLNLAKRAGLESDRRVGAPPKIPQPERGELLKQAMWLAEQVRQFDCDELAERWGLLEGDVWAIRFPMLGPDEVQAIRNQKLPADGSFRGVARRLVVRRSADRISYETLRRHP